MDQYALKICDLHVHFRVYEGIARVLDGVSLDVRAGERVGLAGETGCGKTVTMKAVMGTLRVPPAVIPRGEIFLDGQDVLKKSSQQLLQMKGSKVSMIFQDPMNALNPVFTVGTQLTDVIRFAWSQFGEGNKVSKKKIIQKAVTALEEVKLPDPKRILSSYPFELSGGMRQRILIAMALVNEPKLLIADEPNTALDVTIGAQIMNLLSELVTVKGASLLLITHNLAVIQEMTERVYIMYAGQIVESAPTRLLFSNPKHPYSQGLLASVPRLTGGEIAEGIRGTVPDYTVVPSGCRFHPRCDYAMPICSQKKPPLIMVEPNHYVSCWLYSKGEKLG